MQTLSRNKVLAVLIVQSILIVVLAGAAFKAEYDNGKQQDDIQESLDTSRALFACIITWSDEMKQALDDRDAVNSTARQAAIEWLDAIVKQADDPNANSQTILDLIKQYSDALKKLNKPANEGGFPAHGYPDITKCLEANNLPVPEELRQQVDDSAIGPFKLVSYSVPLLSIPNQPGRFDDRCFGWRVTIRGTRGNDNIQGTNGRDVIFTYSGNDLIFGEGGRDRMCGRWGRDVINGGGGIDRANGGPMDDVCLSTGIERSC